MVTVVTSGAGQIRMRTKRAFLQFRKEREIVRAARSDPSDARGVLRMTRAFDSRREKFRLLWTFLINNMRHNRHFRGE